ncbi:CUB domain-containing protein, partial [Trichonephila clavata]
SIFDLVRPTNSACTGDTGDKGSCLTSRDCAERGGHSIGVCVNGLAQCCYFKFTCSGVTSRNETVFVNPSYPQGENGTDTCQVTVEKQPNVCQLRLDFEEFSLAQPDILGLCTKDSFMVRTTVGERLPILCGENRGQHSPPGCLQYYRSPSETVRSFNFGNPIDSRVRYLSNLRYTVCLRVEENFCSIKWETEKADSFSWGLPENAGASGSTCNDDDFITIDQGSLDGYGAGEDRFCGTSLLDRNTVISRSKPFLLKVRSNSNARENAESSQNGFSLRYIQLPCMI